MSQILVACSMWLHSIATVIFIGHYLLLATIYLPALQDDPQKASAGTTLSAISKRSRYWLYAALLIFAVSGGYLTLVDPNYRGLGNFTNTWGMLMLVKHLLVLVMFGMGFWFNGILRVGTQLVSTNSGVQAFSKFRSHTNWMALLGVLVLLMSAVSQVQ
jgi:uncharacterized membrane protein